MNFIKKIIQMVKTKKTSKEKISEDSGLIGKKIKTKSKLEDLGGDSCWLKPNEEHKVLEESKCGILTDKSNGHWVDKNRFKL